LKGSKVNCPVGRGLRTGVERTHKSKSLHVTYKDSSNKKL